MQAWPDKYRMQHEPHAQPGSHLSVFDFSTVKVVPAADWAAAQAAEARELAARPAALAQAQAAKYHKIVAMPCFTLRNGHRMPAVGLGTWKADKGQVRAAVHLALQAGYRHIDCASVYQNEEEVGEALQAALAPGHVPREELFVCSKVWNNDHAADRVRASCIRSLQALKLTYLDLYLIHWPVTGNVGDEVRPSLQDTWRAMEGLVRDGLVRSIGVSNFSTAKLAAIEAHAQIPPVVCQVEVHPYHRNDALIAWCADRGIHVTAFSPLGSPDSESIFPRKVPAVLLQDPVLQAVAARSKRNVGQVLIRWALQHGTSVIPKSTNPARIRGNLDVLDWQLSPGEFWALSSLAFQQRMVNGALFVNPKGPYRGLQDLWDEPEAEPRGEPGQLQGGRTLQQVLDEARGAQDHPSGAPVESGAAGSSHAAATVTPVQQLRSVPGFSGSVSAVAGRSEREGFSADQGERQLRDLARSRSPIPAAPAAAEPGAGGAKPSKGSKPARWNKLSTWLGGDK